MEANRRIQILGFLVAIACVCMPATALAATEDIIAPSDPANPSADSGWQAGTCKSDAPTECSVDTPDQFFEDAAAHPPVGFTQFIVRQNESTGAPVDELATVRVDLPVGLSVNPGATERCPLKTFEDGASGCPIDSKVGQSFVTAFVPIVGPVAPIPGVTQVDVYSVTPKFGEAARFGLELAGNEVFLEGDVAWQSDYHEGFTIHVPEALPIPLGSGVILKNRLVFDGRSGDGTFLTTPSTCLGPAYQEPWAPGEPPEGPSDTAYSTFLRASSVSEEEDPAHEFPQDAAPALQSPIPPRLPGGVDNTAPKNCDTIPYDPAIAVAPNQDAANSPAGASVDVTVPHLEEEDGQDSSVTRQAEVTLPRGMGINPSAANGLAVCTDEQFGKGSEDESSQCPPGSKIGTVTIKSPPLPEGDLEGDVFVGKQLSRDPLSGQEYRIFIEAKSARYGIVVRLVGNVAADPRTGQLTTTISEAPQVPFTAFELDFNGGDRAVLSSPPTCGPNQTTTAITPYAAQFSGKPPASPGDAFTLSSQPGGGECAKSMAERPFSPAFALGPDSAKAGAYSAMRIRINRGDGQQELKGAEILLAPGMTGRLAGIPYCPESALAAAATRAGQEEAAASSCPAASQVGTATVQAGTGSAPLKIEGGKVFLSGPYNGAPLSLAAVTPATAGPFDLGTVVVRVALFLEPETAQVRAVSDPIPDVFGGTQLSIRAVDLDLDRPRFTLNPTSCDLLASAGALRGGGADPTDPAAFSAFTVNAPFQAADCGALKFRPKLFTRLFGGKKSTKRSKFPKFRAILVARDGDANIRRAALTMPHSMILEQAHIRTICTRVQLAAQACPKGSVYGYARVKTPLLDDELSGPVYLTSSDHELPDLLADLHGQVNVRLRGVISAAKARIKTVFPAVPDVPVSKFVLTMKGGKKGLLVNSRDLCLHPNNAFLNFKSQNGKKLVKKRQEIRVPACKGANGKKKRG